MYFHLIDLSLALIFMCSACYLLSVRRSWRMCGGYAWLWGKFWLYQWYRFILLWLQERLLRWWWNLRRWEIYVNNLQLIKYCKVNGGNNVILFCNVLPCDKTKSCDILKELGIDHKLSRTPVWFIKLVLTIVLKITKVYKYYCQLKKMQTQK